MENNRICNVVFTDYDGMARNETYEYDENGWLLNIHISVDDGIERKIKFLYDDASLLSKCEYYRRSWIWKYVEYEYGEPVRLCTGPEQKVPRKAVSHNQDGSIRDYYTFIFEDEVLLKQLQHDPAGNVRYEFICQYENGRRIRTLKPNLELYSSRIYGENSLLTEIRLSTGGTVCFQYEPLQGRHNYDLYTPC
jgi:hypothetical protein